MLNNGPLQEDWLLSLKRKAAAVHPPATLKNKVMEHVQMRNTKGEVLATVQIDSFQDDEIMDTIIQDLKPGMGVAVYIAGQGEPFFSQQTNYAAVQWEDGLPSLLQLASPMRLMLPHAELQNIQVFYGFDNLTDEEIAEMAAESEQTGNKVVVRNLVQNQTLVGLSLFYSDQETEFEYRIFRTTKSRIHVPDIEQHVIEHLTIRGNEAVYLADHHRQHLIWAEEDTGIPTPLQYEIICDNQNKRWLLGIAHNLHLLKPTPYSLLDG
ncbi:hypothetical protein EBB07_02320 [Paenibacillaceae bacterium]|nr:hypothetical protein EBB07_02320 [Paenibacillaceae bacterium]